MVCSKHILIGPVSGPQWDKESVHDKKLRTEFDGWRLTSIQTRPDSCLIPLIHPTFGEVFEDNIRLVHVSGRHMIPLSQIVSDLAKSRGISASTLNNKLVYPKRDFSTKIKRAEACQVAQEFDIDPKFAWRLTYMTPQQVIDHVQALKGVYIPLSKKVPMQFLIGPVTGPEWDLNDLMNINFHGWALTSIQKRPDSCLVPLIHPTFGEVFEDDIRMIVVSLTSPGIDPLAIAAQLAESRGTSPTSVAIEVVDSRKKFLHKKEGRTLQKKARNSGLEPKYAWRLTYMTPQQVIDHIQALEVGDGSVRLPLSLRLLIGPVAGPQWDRKDPNLKNEFHGWTLTSIQKRPDSCLVPLIRPTSGEVFEDDIRLIVVSLTSPGIDPLTIAAKLAESRGTSPMSVVIKALDTRKDFLRDKEEIKYKKKATRNNINAKHAWRLAYMTPTEVRLQFPLEIKQTEAVESVIVPPPPTRSTNIINASIADVPPISNMTTECCGAIQNPLSDRKEEDEVSCSGCAFQ